MLMMTRGYQESFAALHGASGDDLLALLRTDFALERSKEIARLNERNSTLAAEVSRLEYRAASLEQDITAQREQNQDIASDPVWKLTAPLRRLGASARRVAGKLTGSGGR
jgi:uncharacterized protein YlxW (UPF0749 family)